MQILDFRSIAPKSSDYTVYSYDGKYKYLCPKSHPEESLIVRKAAGLEEYTSVLTDYRHLSWEQMRSLFPNLSSVKILAAVLIHADWAYDPATSIFHVGEVESHSPSVEGITEEVAEPAEESLIEISYDGSTTEVVSNNHPVVITTHILGEEIDYEFVHCLVTYCRLNNARLYIFLKKRYISDKEPTSSLDKLTSLISEVGTIVFSGNLTSHDGQMLVAANGNVHHTAIKPLAGFKNTTVKYLAIPHARQEAVTTYANNYEGKSLLMSTGCINTLSSGHTQALAKVKFHSIKGFLVYERDNTYPFRHVNYSSANHSIVDLDREFHRDGVNPAQIEAVYLDDLHCVHMPSEYRARVSRLLQLLNPKEFGSGDVFDGSSLNHHEVNRLGYLQNRISLIDEIKLTEECLKTFQRAAPASKMVILSSNHHNFFDKFTANLNIVAQLPKHDAALVFRTLAYMVENTEYQHLKGVKYADPTRFLLSNLDYQDKFTVGNNHHIDFNLHGHEYGIGAAANNGSNKITTGHGHAGFIDKGHHRVGCSFKEANYQSGYSASCSAIDVLANNGKRQLLFHF